ncbi:rhomboid family intramembrane serine protease [Litchfieldia salsa]|uniref:Rhomboid protease GluP n=1 Tax=Litchfieldia salsa TaxID=930152 RepID=A0A1H0VBZ5_9BACI|nr:rhomboid family intramembrane serine protease [Litchfieldia salsa]SDP75977.1 rhomboid protease GluP [Litchfieldia salsa]
MVFQQDYLYWNTIHQLVVEHQYRLIQLSQSQNEVWLESNNKNAPTLVRIVRYDLDWANWMQRDMEQAGRRIEEVRKRMNKRKMNALNLYISTFPPVDEWREKTDKPLLIGAKEQTSLMTKVIHSENIQEGLKDLSDILGEKITLEIEGVLYDYIQVEELKSKVLTVSNERTKQEKKIFSYGKPYFTYLFIFIQIFMFLVLEVKGGSTNTETLITFGAKDNYLLLQGEWWRFFTPIILHIGFFHLVMNTLALYFLGSAVEKIYGRTKFLVLYLVAGFAGTLASFVFSPAISAGASGAIFGCFGALLFFGVIHPSLFFRTMGSNVIVVIGINLLIGFIFPVVDNAGHIGGLIGGFIASSFLHLPGQKKYLQRTISFLLAAALLIAMLYVGYQVQPTSNDPAYAVRLAKTYIEEDKVNEAYELLIEAEKKNENIPAELYFYLSFTEVQLGKLTDAKEHLEIVTKELPTLHEAQYNLALVYSRLEEYEKAKSSIEKALNEDPENKDYQSVLSEINDYLEHTE